MPMKKILLWANGVLLTPLFAGIGAFVGFYHSDFTLTASIGFAAAICLGLIYLKKLRQTY